ncbi:helix-turn-helix domain-containing protein [Streptacidiphilus melanogenes]|uniref:helix-turn-helix domain-containing protein n=1 Tax=Streptacidiphilus melanogenes TaxID=411235 RepID=UPI0009FE0CD4|nr:XRE family transcriptional regulator [Streptacidiphilus melanogenes]
MHLVHRPAPQVGDVARLFDGRRLRLARQLAGLRKNALAAMIGKTPTAVASYENGTKRPAAATVAQLCLSLGVEPAFFLSGPGEIDFSERSPHFRSLRSTTQISRDQAAAYGLATIDAAASLERHVEFPEVNVLPFPVDVDLEIIQLPERAARELRFHWKIPDGPVGHLVRIAENQGILVVFSPVQAASVDAYSFDSRVRPVIVLNPVKQDYFRQRFDVAHEIGHLVMHADSEPGGRKIEDQAQAFAAEFLMPAEQMRDILPSSADWPRLSQIKQTWGVSLQALLYRSRSLGVMSEVTYRNAITYLSAKGWRRQEPGVMPALEQPSLMAQAVSLLEEDGVKLGDIAYEARVPLSLLETIVARTPQFPVGGSWGNGSDAASLPHGVSSILSASRFGKEG